MSRFRSHDEMAEAIGDARLATYVLAPAVREWELRALRLGDVLLQYGADGAPHVTTGRMLPARVGFLVTGGASAPRSCNGHVVDAASIFRWGSGAEVALLAREPGDGWLLSATPEAVARAAASRGGGGGGKTPVPSGLVKATPAGMAELRELFGEAEVAFERAGPAGLSAEAARRLGETLLGAVVRLSCGESAPGRPSRGPRVDRGRIVSRVEEVFAEAESRPLYLESLSEALGVPERTLRLVFTEQYGAGPTRVLRCRRLCQAHRALLHAPAGARVAEIAGRCGFWHLGLFSSEYRALLGELPSETLRRSSAGGRALVPPPGEWVPAPAAEAGTA